MPIQDGCFRLMGFIFHFHRRSRVLADVFFAKADAVIAEERYDFDAPWATRFHVENGEVVGHGKRRGGGWLGKYDIPGSSGIGFYRAQIEVDVFAQLAAFFPGECIFCHAIKLYHFARRRIPIFGRHHIDPQKN